MVNAIKHKKLQNGNFCFKVSFDGTDASLSFLITTVNLAVVTSPNSRFLGTTAETDANFLLHLSESKQLDYTVQLLYTHQELHSF